MLLDYKQSVDRLGLRNIHRIKLGDVFLRIFHITLRVRHGFQTSIPLTRACSSSSSWSRNSGGTTVNGGVASETILRHNALVSSEGGETHFAIRQTRNHSVSFVGYASSGSSPYSRAVSRITRAIRIALSCRASRSA